MDTTANDGDFWGDLADRFTGWLGDALDAATDVAGDVISRRGNDDGRSNRKPGAGAAARDRQTKAIVTTIVVAAAVVLVVVLVKRGRG
jgi:hypothetical protein